MFLRVMASHEKAKLCSLDTADCKHCGRWMNHRSRHQHQKSCQATLTADNSTIKPGMFGKYGEEVPQFVFDCFDASSLGGTWIDEEIAWEDIFPYVHASSSLRVPPGTEEDVHKAFCIPLAMYSLADDINRRDLAYKLVVIMRRRRRTGGLRRPSMLS